MEEVEYAEFNVATCGLQFVSYAEKDKVCPDSVLDSPDTSPTFQMKELERTTEAIARVNARWSMLSLMCQHVACSLSAMQRRTKPFSDSILFLDEGDSGRFA